MNDRILVRVAREQLSRTMSLALRHDPERFGLVLDEGGWVEIDALVNGLRSRGTDASYESVRDVVENGSKVRHEIDGDRIRARYGHSVDGRIDMPVDRPPAVLYHGTTAASAAKIDVDGLRPMGRQFVHLSPSYETARTVGSRRRGELVIFEVDTPAALGAGLEFRRGNEDTWLTGEVPAAFLRRLPVAGV